METGCDGCCRWPSSFPFLGRARRSRGGLMESRLRHCHGGLPLHWLTPQPPPSPPMMAGRGARPLRWRSVLVFLRVRTSSQAVPNLTLDLSSRTKKAGLFICNAVFIKLLLMYVHNARIKCTHLQNNVSTRFINVPSARARIKLITFKASGINCDVRAGMVTSLL